jgi:phosphoribosyl 1,2-cyclic phosphodiesterase
MKAIIWGSCGSLPCPASSASIRQKVRDALWAARETPFENLDAVDAYLDRLPHSATGTYKANTSCVQIEAGTSEYIFCDAGTGLRDFALSLGPKPPVATYHIFISHLHWDHIQGFPFFNPAYQPGNRIIFHGFHQTTEAAIRMQMNTPCFPVPFETMQADIEFDIRKDGDEFDVGDVHISTIKQQHPGDSWGFCFEQAGKRIIYSSDSEHGPEAREDGYPFIDFFRNADVLIFDGQYTFEEATNEKRHWGHSDHITAVELAARAKVRQLIVFHHEPAYSDVEIEEIHSDAIRYSQQYNQNLSHGAAGPSYPQRIELAFDGMTIETHTNTAYMSETSATPTIEKRSISKAEINELPLIEWEGEIQILDTVEAMEAAVAKLIHESHLGFDTETRPTFKKGEYYPPALIQLATDDCVYLFRISKTASFAPLLPILESDTILKTGVAIKDDVKELRAMEEFKPAGFVEIADITLKLGYENRGLRPLAGLLLEGRISKAAQVSNWAREELDKKQIRYAATDAWISREIYRRALEEQSQQN